MKHKEKNALGKSLDDLSSEDFLVYGRETGKVSGSRKEGWICLSILFRKHYFEFQNKNRVISLYIDTVPHNMMGSLEKKFVISYKTVGNKPSDCPIDIWERHLWNCVFDKIYI